MAEQDNITTTIQFNSRQSVAIFGTGNEYLKMIQKIVDRATLINKENSVIIMAEPEIHNKLIKVFEQMKRDVKDGIILTRNDVINILKNHGLYNERVVKVDKVSVKQRTGSRRYTIKTSKASIVPRSKNQQKFVESIDENYISIGMGAAGTGKTFLAVAKAVEMYEQKLVERIIITRPVVEAGENLGFLPGGLEEKLDPYLRPIYDSLNALMLPEKVERLLEKKDIEIVPLAYMRGRTLSNAFIILDEAQNTTVPQMLMVLTRFGENSKMAITGDHKQGDLPKKITSGLKHATVTLHDIKGINVVEFGKEDVVRHHIVSLIIDAYDKADLG